MNYQLIFAVFSTLAITGCASSLVTYDSKGQKTKGIVVHSPVLVKITTETTYKVDPSNVKHKEFCTPEQNSTYEFLPLGEKSYINFDSASFGKSEFSIEFAEKGSLKGVSLNSDASAGVEKVTSLLGTVLPFVAKPKAEIETKAVVPDTAQKMKEKYCIKSGENVTGITPVVVQ